MLLLKVSRIGLLSTNRNILAMETLIQKYKSKLLNHLLWIDENIEHMTRTEKMLFDLHLSILKDVIKDLEEMK